MTPPSGTSRPEDHPAPAPPGPAVAVLGLGQMGLVCAAILANPDGSAESPNPAARTQPDPDPPHKARALTLWGHDDAEVGSLAQTRRSPRLDNFELPLGVTVALSDAAALADAELIVSAVPVQATRDAWTRLRPHVPPAAKIVSVAKGLERDTLLRPTQIIADVLADDPDGPPRPIGTLSGPTIAAELSRCLPATVIAAADDPAFAEHIQSLFSTSWLRVYTNTDLLGVELAGAIKNVIAIAAGILDGLQAGHNAKSALLARGLAEIARLGSAMGGRNDTFFGIAGVGDLATTCFSPEGRNRSCGEALGRGHKLDDYLRSTPFVVEGVETTRAVVALADKYRVDMPITRAVHAVLFDKLDPIEAIGNLMARELKHERIG